VVSQKGLDGKIHPIVFHSQKFNPAEMNYEIYNKEMLAIVESLEHYWHYFEGLGQQITVYSDHHNLLWFTKTKIYNRRQVRWAEKLSKFDFIIVFRPGKDGGKPDTPSRRPDYAEQARGEDQTMTFLRPNQVDTLAIVEELKAPPEQTEVAARSAKTGVRDDAGVEKEIRDALQEDPDVQEYLRYLREPMLLRNEELQNALEPFTLEEDGLLLHDGLVYVPANDAIKLEILRSCHDSRAARHLGQEKTLELISRDYYWPQMRRFVNKYVWTCDTCARNKVPRHRRHGELHPLPIPAGPWESVSMDFIVELPPS